MHAKSKLLAHELNTTYTLIKLSCLDVRGEIDRIPGVSFHVALLSVEPERFEKTKRHAERDDTVNEK